jgi:hypothetical protein
LRAVLAFGRRVLSSAGRFRRASAWGRAAPVLGLFLIAKIARSEPAKAGEPLRAAPAAPRPEPRGPTALLTGLSIAGTSFGLAGFMLATDAGLPVKHGGLAVLHGGLTLAPLAAHGVVGEWGRGAVFAIAPALGGIGMAALLSERPEAPVVGKNKSHRIYPVLITASVVGSAVGIFDAALVDERAPVRVHAAASDEFAGAWVEGNF